MTPQALGLAETDFGNIRPSGFIVAPQGDLSPRRKDSRSLREAEAGDWSKFRPVTSIVLRPDRYVAACVPLSQWHRRRAEIAALVTSTFDGLAAPAT